MSALGGKADIRKPTLRHGVLNRSPESALPGAGPALSLAAEELKWMIIETTRLSGISVSVKAW